MRMKKTRWIYEKNEKRIEAVFILLIIATGIFLHFYNASSLSGGDDSQYAELAFFGLHNKSIIAYPKFPDMPISWRNMQYARPMAVAVYALSIMLFGYTKYAIIFPAMIFSILSVILFYFIIKR